MYKLLTVGAGFELRPLAAYNSLTDKHLTGYFNNTRIRRHLQRVGLVTRSGRIVSEREYRLSLVHKDHQKYVRETLAQAIFHKVLNMQRLHQQEIRKRLEDLAQRDRIQQVKIERARRVDEGTVPVPRPPATSRNCHRSLSGPNVGQPSPSYSSTCARPSTAPGKMQRPPRLLPLQGTGASGATAITTQSSPRPWRRDQQLELVRGINAQFLYRPARGAVRNGPTVEFPTSPSPYRLPVLNNYVTPVPPSSRPSERSSVSRARCLRPTTAPHHPDILAPKEPLRWRRSDIQSNVLVTMVYHGKRLHLSYHPVDARDEVKVHQQHCGGENLCIFKGKLLEADRFQFVSRRHSGFPFSLTFFVNGLQVDRLSSCCEFRHRRGSRLGGRRPYFTILAVDGAAPCYRCIIAAGLDKKPSPPPKRLKGRGTGLQGWRRTVLGPVAVEDTHGQVGSSRMDEGQRISAQEYTDDFEEGEESRDREERSSIQSSEESMEETTAGHVGARRSGGMECGSVGSTLSDAEHQESPGSDVSCSSPDYSRCSEGSDSDRLEGRVAEEEEGRLVDVEEEIPPGPTEVCDQDPEGVADGEAKCESIGGEGAAGEQVPGTLQLTVKMQNNEDHSMAPAGDSGSLMEEMQSCGKSIWETGGDQPRRTEPPGEAWCGTSVDVCAAELSPPGRPEAGELPGLASSSCTLHAESSGCCAFPPAGHGER
ncbi:glutamate-rich protein 3 isoform X2 [Narcine bancroftii]|uniref:glutamate-rich protein 3 isoform X2 n=1 Tax=Narcine bancroftii TaxID=1343680 RepID=UPI00383153CB